MALLGCDASRDPADAWLQELIERSPESPVPSWSPEIPDQRAATAQLAWHALWVAGHVPDSLPQIIDAATRVVERIDPVWGGVLEYTPVDLVALHEPDTAAAGAPVLAKTLGTQALALEVFAVVYQATGEQRFANAFALVDEYVQDWLRRRDGRYAQGQRARPEGLRSGLTVADYWNARREHDRRSLGVPAVYGDADVAVQLDLARAYLAAASVFADANYRAEADRLLAANPGVLSHPCGIDARRFSLQVERWRQQSDADALPELRQQLLHLLEARRQAAHCSDPMVGESQDLARVALAAALTQLMDASRDRSLAPAPELLVRQALYNVRTAEPAVQLRVLATAQRFAPHPEQSPPKKESEPQSE